MLSLPELIDEENHEKSGKLWYYESLTEKCLINIDVPLEAILCCNINCNNQSPIGDLRMYYDIVNCLHNSSSAFCQKRVRQYNLRPELNEYVSELHSEAKEAFRN